MLGLWGLAGAVWVWVSQVCFYGFKVAGPGCVPHVAYARALCVWLDSSLCVSQAGAVCLLLARAVPCMWAS